MGIFLLFLIVFICFVLNNCLRYITEDYIKLIQNSTLRSLLEFLIRHKLETSLVLGCILAFNAYYGIVLGPQHRRNRIKKRIVERINAELFRGDLRHHRITLFREVGYLRGWIHHIYSALYHLFHYPSKFRLYLHWLPVGKNLVIDKRASLQYKKSTTMFKVEEHEERNCQGVVGLIRFQQSEVLVENLPDIESIDLEKIDITCRRKADARKVLEYMKRAHVRLRDFRILRKLHSKARHFYGTVIRDREGNIWGVLLADSISLNSPFDKITRERFDSFAETLGDIL